MMKLGSLVSAFQSVCESSKPRFSGFYCTTSAGLGETITLTLEDEIDISRGNVIVKGK
jgi:sulfate adenylyltransferase subunit 1 (EFTu-like GTPase family)